MFENENNFSAASNDFLKDLEGLETAFTDPFVEHVLDMARTYNKIFEEDAPSDEEKSLIIAELDAQWGVITGSQVHYTGRVRTLAAEAEENDEDAVKQTIFLDGAEVISNGYCIVDEPRYINGEYVGEISRVKHHLYIYFKDAYGIDEDEKGRRMTIGTGEIDNSIIELDTASPERARAWLEVSCPELLEEIDLRILNGSGGEDEALLSLKWLDLSKWEVLDDTFTRNCVMIYLNNIIEVDTTAPYSAKLSGFARMNEDESLLYKINLEEALIYLNPLTMQPAFNLEDKTRWALSACVSVVPKDRTKQPWEYIIPVETIQTLISIRGAYYGSNS